MIANEILAAKKILATNEIDSIEDSNELIKKLVESKTRKLSKSQKLVKPKNCQKVGIYLNLPLKKSDQVF